MTGTRWESRGPFQKASFQNFEFEPELKSLKTLNCPTQSFLNTCSAGLIYSELKLGSVTLVQRSNKPRQRNAHNLMSGYSENDALFSKKKTKKK